MFRSSYLRSRVPIGRRGWAALGTLALLAAALVTVAPATPVAAAPSAESRFEPIDPVRVLDTRDGTGGHLGKVPAGGAVAVPVASRLPADATAVVLNVTVVEPSAFGFITAYSGTTRPGTSNANTDQIGEIAANLVVVPLGGSTDVRVYASMDTHLVVDLLGWFVPAAGSTAGRYRAVDPAGARILDTRNESATPPALAARRAVPVRGRAGVPATGVRAVALNVTVTETAVPGWLQVVPTGGTTAPGGSSNVNVTTAGQTVANLVLVPVGADGSVTLVGSLVGHVVVDVAGWFTDSSAASGTDGLFVAVDPVRLTDTRSGGGARPGAGATLPVSAAVAGVDVTRVGAVLANLTVTDAAAPGYVTGWAGVGTVPVASNINADHAGATVANAGIVATNGSGFALYTSAGTHLVVDLLGWFTRTGTTGGGGGAPSGAGAVISTETTSGGYKIRYRSVGAAGALTNQKTLAYVPAGTPPAGGWPIMAVVHGPWGLGDGCAPSLTDGAPPEALPWLAAGYAVVEPDLEGIGVDSPGDHPYLHGPGTGRSVLDAIRAARSVYGGVLSNKIAAWGFSSGAHGSLWVGEMAPSYAPELDVRGIISLDPIDMISEAMGSTWTQAGFTVWWVQGQHAGDPVGLPYSEVLKPEAIALLPQLNAGCLDQTYPLFDAIPGGPLLANPLSLPNWAAAFHASDPGWYKSAPVFLAGGNDFTSSIPALPHEWHQNYINRACALGSSVLFRIFNGSHMVMETQPVQDAALAWIDARMAGTPQTGCTTTGP